MSMWMTRVTPEYIGAAAPVAVVEVTATRGWLLPIIWVDIAAWLIPVWSPWRFDEGSLPGAVNFFLDEEFPSQPLVVWPGGLPERLPVWAPAREEEVVPIPVAVFDTEGVSYMVIWPRR